MFDGIYCELLKLKRTGYYTCVFLMGIICLYFSTMNRQMLKSLNWYGYFTNFEFVAFTIFYALVIPNIIALIFIREFTCKTAPIEFSYPGGRFTSFINKFILSVLLIAIIYITSYILVVISGLIFIKTPLTVEVLINHMKVFLISFAFQVALVPLTAMVALLGKNMIISFVYSFGLIIGNVNYILDMKHREYIFSILPALPIAKLRVPVCTVPLPINLLITNFDIYLGIFVFVIGITGCLIFYRKANIY